MVSRCSVILASVLFNNHGFSLGFRVVLASGVFTFKV